jgi:hypothetical protein
LKTVVRLVEPLVNLGYALRTDIYYNYLSPCSLLTDDGVNVTDTLHLHREHVCQLVKSETLAKGESVAAQCNGIMVMKWRDKREVSLISTFHDNTLQTQIMTGIEVSKPKSVGQCDLAMEVGT